MAAIRVGIVGAGRIVPAHLHGYKALRAAGFDDFRITAVCSRDPERAHALVGTDGRRAGGMAGPPSMAADPLLAPPIAVSDFQDDAEVQVFTDVRDMLAAGVVDAVDITTEVSVHHTQALAAIEAGCHAVVQKPLAISVRAARMMLDAAQQRGVSLAVLENARYNRSVRIAKWLVDRGDLGTPQMVSVTALGTAMWSPDHFVGNSPWRHQKLVGAGGASLDIGPHIFHRLRMLCGEVESVAAFARVFEPTRYYRDVDGNVVDTVQCDADDAFMAVACFESGAIGQLSFSFAGHGDPMPSSGLNLFGSKGSLRGDALHLDGQEPTSLEAYFLERATAAEVARLFPRDLSDSFALLYESWLGGILNGTPAETSGQEGLHDLAASFAIVEASQAGRAVRLSEVLDGSVDAYQRDLDEHYGLLGQRTAREGYPA
ncbi:MAG: Gfo/Idh/MocA family oxidoreductase [Chloroflexi bacterium]|nr:Gfo/Idh/MocA family oxidoreductase [Chloroflexota bacterium]